MALKGAKRTVKEQGIVIEKFHRDATKEFTKDGRTFPAKAETDIAVVVSSPDFSEEYGYTNGSYQQYEVDRKAFMSMKFGTPVEVELELTNYGARPLSLTIISSKKTA